MGFDSNGVYLFSFSLFTSSLLDVTSGIVIIVEGGIVDRTAVD